MINNAQGNAEKLKEMIWKYDKKWGKKPEKSYKT